MPSETTPGFRRVRYTSAGGTSYRTVFEREYGGRGMDDADFAENGARFEYTVTGDDDISMRTLDAAGVMRRGTIGPRGDHVVFWLGRGQLTMHFDGRAETVVPGAPYVASASSSYHFESVDTLYFGVHVSDSFLREVARETGMRLPPGDLVFAQQDDRIAGLAPLRTLMNELGPRFGVATLTRDERRVLNARIAATVLETFPVTAGGAVVGASRRLRDAVEFVHAEAGSDVALGDIAAAAELSERGLQQLFKRNLGVSPMTYLRDVRLDRVRQDLLAARPETGRPRPGVGSVARAWRLNHLGRFAAGYRARFGELPADTVRGRRD